MQPQFHPLYLTLHNFPPAYPTLPHLTQRYPALYTLPQLTQPYPTLFHSTPTLPHSILFPRSLSYHFLQSTLLYLYFTLTLTNSNQLYPPTNSPMFLPDPRDGSLYMVNEDDGSGKTNLRKMSFTIPELVQSSPCKSVDGMLYTG